MPDAFVNIRSRPGQDNTNVQEALYCAETEIISIIFKAASKAGPAEVSVWGATSSKGAVGRRSTLFGPTVRLSQREFAGRSLLADSVNAC